ncbi:glycosyltransferase family 4 protein [Micromonospora sp. BRA006-A]|nr:glycosyltransferase family 4 protein [Micromonospora sp. BRA006-A]
MDPPQVEELRRRGHQVVAILPRATGRLTGELRQRGVEVHDSPFDFRFRPRPSTLRDLWRLRRLINRLRPDALKYHLYASALAARFASLRLPLRRVHMVAGPLYPESPLIKIVERALWRLDHVTICGTGHTSGLYGALGCPAPRRPVVTYGARAAHFAELEGSAGRREVRAKARAELGIEEDAFVVIMVAYVYPPRRLVHKGRGIRGHDVLLAAWREFRADHPDARLLLVGAGFSPAGEAHRRELIRRFEVDRDPSVTWLTSVSDVRDCYRAADLSVSPSLSEGHGAACEAGASGVPASSATPAACPRPSTRRPGGWCRATTCRRWSPRCGTPTGSSPTAGSACGVSGPSSSPCGTSTTRWPPPPWPTWWRPPAGPAGDLMRVVVTSESRFSRTPDGAVWVEAGPDHTIWRRYLVAFDRVRVAARVRDVAQRPAAASRVDGDGVEVWALPYYVGPRGYLLGRRALAEAVTAAAAPRDAVVLRVPSPIGALLARARSRARLPYPR